VGNILRLGAGSIGGWVGGARGIGLAERREGLVSWARSVFMSGELPPRPGPELPPAEEGRVAADGLRHWRVVLAWGCLGLFFGIPLIFFGLHLWSLNHEPSFYSHASEFRYMSDFLKTVTAIIISLAGLGTIELFKK
jgi:hypothetical protein